MTKTVRAITAVLLLGLVTGCGSSPATNYYLLSAQELPAPVRETPTLGVGPITIPEYLNRYSLVTKREGNQLAISGLEQWAEPLRDGIQRVVTINLAGLLGTQNIRLFPWQPEQQPSYVVRINLLGLDASEKEATLSAEWLVLGPPDSGTVARRLSQLQLPFPSEAPGPDEIAAAYSTLLFQLSEEIAGAITSADDRHDIGGASGVTR